MGMFGKPKIEVDDLFPHPLHWRIKTNGKRLPITKRTAQIVLATLNDYPETKPALSKITIDLQAAIIT
jgi:hypothetical protein